MLEIPSLYTLENFAAPFFFLLLFTTVKMCEPSSFTIFAFIFSLFISLLTIPQGASKPEALGNCICESGCKLLASTGCSCSSSVVPSPACNFVGTEACEYLCSSIAKQKREKRLLKNTH